MASIDEELKAIQLRKARLELENLLARQRMWEVMTRVPVHAIKAFIRIPVRTGLFLLRHVRTILAWLLVGFLLSIAALGLFSYFARWA
jgi:hypothetical protein